MSSEDAHYAGRWFVPGSDKPLDGVLHRFGDGGALLLELSTPYRRGLPGRGFADLWQLTEDKLTHIFGELFSGARVTLLDCSLERRSVQYGQYVTELASAAYAFWGIDARGASAPQFRGAIVDFGDIVRWSGLCHVEWDRDDEGDTFSWRRSEGYKLEIGAGAHLDISPTLGSISFQSYERQLSITQLVAVKFRYESERSWQLVMADADWFRRLVELGKGARVGIEKAHYLHSSVTFPADSGFEDDEILRPGDVTIGVGESDSHHGKDHPFLYLFDLSEAMECGALASWVSQREPLGPVIDLYSLVYSDKIPSASALFLNLMQALETFHSRFFASGKREYLERVDVLCSASGDSGLRDFLCDSGQRRAGSVYLRSRIADLLYADGLRPVNPQNGRFADYPKRLVDTRNYYTHYDRSRLETIYALDELPIVNTELRVLLEYHLMLQLGFDEELARERARRRLRY